MQIVKYPPIYSPAFGEVVFQISAAAEELLELDILANWKTRSNRPSKDGSN